MARRARRAIKWEYNPRWNYVRERLMDPGECVKGSYRTLSSRNIPSMPGGVLVVTCCPKGTRRSRGGRCCSGTSCRSSKPQAIRHSVERFRFRHKDIWRRLQQAPAGRGGTRVVWGTSRRARRVA